MIQKKLFDNSYSLGSWIQIGDPEFTKLMAMSGFDFLVIDMEHGSISENDLVPLFKAFEGLDCVPLVRVAKNDNILIPLRVFNS